MGVTLALEEAPAHCPNREVPKERARSLQRVLFTVFTNDFDNGKQAAGGERERCTPGTNAERSGPTAGGPCEVG